ncbi:MAG: hypothetical protein M1837_005137 [Sclerophora amabilis]|nr:MAG: hypothetical protein M1837_005137 [Sclerophora amabilis]
MSPTFDPFAQSFTLLLRDGTPFNVTLPDLETFNLYNIRICINYGSQVGATLLLLVVLLMLTKPDRRQSMLFVVNSLCLAFNFIRSLLQCLYFTGGFNVAYAYFASDYSRVNTSDYAESVTANVFTMLVLLCVEVSLFLQVNVVCVTMRREHRHGILAISGLVALIAVGFRLALVIENSKAILAAEDFGPWEWLASATNITATISICFFSAIFSVKLGFAMHHRKKMGIHRFGPMQIIFIMGCQTMVIPALFSILQYVSDAPELGTNVLTLAAIFLPLSSMWASASLDGQSQVSGSPNAQQKLFGSYGSGSNGPARSKRGGNGPTSPAHTTLTHGSSSPLVTPNRAEMQSVDRDLEAQGLGIRVDRTFGIHETHR